MLRMELGSSSFHQKLMLFDGVIREFRRKVKSQSGLHTTPVRTEVVELPISYDENNSHNIECSSG